jgi:hypothetical protein
VYLDGNRDERRRGRYFTTLGGYIGRYLPYLRYPYPDVVGGERPVCRRGWFRTIIRHFVFVTSGP